MSFYASEPIRSLFASPVNGVSSNVLEITGHLGRGIERVIPPLVCYSNALRVPRVELQGCCGTAESEEHIAQNLLVTVLDYRPGITKVSIDTFDTHQHDRYKFSTRRREGSAAVLPSLRRAPLLVRFAGK